jgi:hypothetical protein
MNAFTPRQFAGSAVAAAIVCAANLVAVAPATADINIGALACQPPFLDQAAQLRWHEHYLINPLEAGSVATWVVCPIAFDSNDLIPNSIRIGAFGNTTPGGNPLTLCYANVVDIRNQNIPTFGFLVNPGQDMRVTKRMQSQTPAGTLWSAWADFTVANIVANMDSPPPTPVADGGVQGPAFWTITVNCELKPGQALNMVSLWPTKTFAIAP